MSPYFLTTNGRRSSVRSCSRNLVQQGISISHTFLHFRPGKVCCVISSRFSKLLIAADVQLLQECLTGRTIESQYVTMSDLPRGILKLIPAAQFLVASLSLSRNITALGSEELRLVSGIVRGRKYRQPNLERCRFGECWTRKNWLVAFY